MGLSLRVFLAGSFSFELEAFLEDFSTFLSTDAFPLDSLPCSRSSLLSNPSLLIEGLSPLWVIFDRRPISNFDRVLEKSVDFEAAVWIPTQCYSTVVSLQSFLLASSPTLGASCSSLYLTPNLFPDVRTQVRVSLLRALLDLGWISEISPNSTGQANQGCSILNLILKQGSTVI